MVVVIVEEEKDRRGRACIIVTVVGLGLVPNYLLPPLLIIRLPPPSI
jgi:hypothetical protein